jgi:hypothetical protein
MNKRQAFVVSIILLSTLVVASAAWANGTRTVDWCIMGSGGGHAEAGPYSLDTTIGQTVAGVNEDTDLELCSGFWCGVGTAHTIYLPLVIRNA